MKQETVESQFFKLSIGTPKYLRHLLLQIIGRFKTLKAGKIEIPHCFCFTFILQCSYHVCQLLKINVSDNANLLLPNQRDKKKKASVDKDHCRILITICWFMGKIKVSLLSPGWVVWKLATANQGLKVSHSINFSSIN